MTPHREPLGSLYGIHALLQRIEERQAWLEKHLLPDGPAADRLRREQEHRYRLSLNRCRGD